MAEVVAGVRGSAAPVPLEALADRALRALGHEKTIATGWAGAGSFRELLRQQLPEEIRLTDEPPYLAFDAKRHGEDGTATALEAREPPAEAAAAAAAAGADRHRTGDAEPEPEAAARPRRLRRQGHGERRPQPPRRRRGACPRPRTPDGSAAASPRQLAAAPPAASSAAIQQSIARIQEACQAPPLAPPEYRLLFEVMAKEISDNDLIGAQTLANITQRAQERGLDVRRDDVRFVLEVVSEADPWFEQGASANLFAGRFRNFVVARCRGQGLNLSADELDLIDAWFAGGTLPQPLMTTRQRRRTAASAGATCRRPPVRWPRPPAAAAPAPSGGGRSRAGGPTTTAARSSRRRARRAPRRRAPRARRRRGLPAHRAHAACAASRVQNCALADGPRSIRLEGRRLSFLEASSGARPRSSSSNDGLEHRGSQRRLDVQRARRRCCGSRACGRPARSSTGRPCSVAALVLDPDLGLAVEHGQHLLDRVQVRRRALAGVAPLLEDAQLHRAGDGRDVHARQHAGAPLLARLASS